MFILNKFALPNLDGTVNFWRVKA